MNEKVVAKLLSESGRKACLQNEFDMHRKDREVVVLARFSSRMYRSFFLFIFVATSFSSTLVQICLKSLNAEVDEDLSVSMTRS